MTNFTINNQGAALNQQSEMKSSSKRSIVKSFKLATMVAIIAITAALPAAAQVSLGVRGGFTLNKMHFDREVINSDNRIGYSAGLVLDINIPVTGLGVEASAMYTHRDNKLHDDNHTYKRHYIEVPVYARYRLAIPAVEKIIAPYVFTGPNFSFLFKDDAPTNIKNSKTSTSWDVGLGVDLLKHLRVSATYGIGMSKAMEYIDRDYTGETVTGKDKHWTVSAAWMF